MKNHNQFYNKIPINYNWCSSVPDSEIPDLLICGGNVDESDKTSTNNEQLNGNTLSEEDVICDRCGNQTVKNVMDNTLHGNSTNVSDGSNITTDDPEFVKDQIALELKENLTGDVLPSMLQFENIENVIFQCAPAQNNIPMYVLLDEEFELLAFPDLFPLG